MTQDSTEETTAPKKRHHLRWRRTLVTISSLLIFGIVAAACSSSSATPTTTSKAGGSTTATLVSTTNTNKFGTILVNNKGFALYTLSGNAACDAACRAIWPPLMVSGSGTPNLGGVSGLGTVKVSGGEQVTDDGMRLYTFVQDKSPGQVTGQGLKDMWGTWSVVTTGGSPTTPTTGATTTTTAGGGGGGVGF